MTGAADNVRLCGDAGHLAAVVTDNDQIPARIIQQFCGVDQQSFGCNGDGPVACCW
jgi:hypothetical protein